MLVLHQAVCQLGNTTLLFDAQFAQHSCTVLVGASGAGKTTLLNVLAGFITPISGDIVYQEQSLLPLIPAKRPFTSLFQEHNLFAHLSVFDNVAIGVHPGLTLNETQTQQVQQALAQVGLSEKGQQLPTYLSGGQRQRVALARAIVRRQPWLLLDEPFSALDPGLRQEMMALLKQLQAAHNLSIILVSHDPEEALQLASDVMFIAEGGVYWQGCVDDFFSQQGDVFSRYLGETSA